MTVWTILASTLTKNQDLNVERSFHLKSFKKTKRSGTNRSLPLPLPYMQYQKIYYKITLSYEIMDRKSFLSFFPTVNNKSRTNGYSTTVISACYYGPLLFIRKKIKVYQTELLQVGLHRTSLSVTENDRLITVYLAVGWLRRL